MPAKFVSLFVAQLFFPRLFVVQVSSFQESPGQWDVHLRRKRFAFALAARWKGASIDGAEAPVRSANPDKQRACCFSSTILANSVGEHLPCDSIQLLRPIVSNEENINSVTIAGSRTAFRRLVFFIKRDWSIQILLASRFGGTPRRGCIQSRIGVDASASRSGHCTKRKKFVR